jgi:hypothetical protein
MATVDEDADAHVQDLVRCYVNLLPLHAVINDLIHDLC